MEFITDQFIVRKLRPEDLKPYFEMVCNEKVMQFIKPPLNFTQSVAELCRFMSYYQQTDKYYYIWAVIDRSRNNFLGICGVYKNEQLEYEIAYRLLEKYWGKGYGFKIAKALLSHCFSTLGIKEAVAYIHQNNSRSIRIISKLNSVYSLHNTVVKDELRIVIKES